MNSLRGHLLELNVPHMTLKLDIGIILNTVGNLAFLFNFTPVGKISDSITVPTFRLIY